MIISIGNDHGGCNLAVNVIKFLEKHHVGVFYYGTFDGSISVDYPDFVFPVINDIRQGNSQFGVLICRSGVGMCIAANKYNGIRAVNATVPEMAVLSRQHNDANVLCLGSHFVSKKSVNKIVEAFVTSEFLKGRHLNRLNKLSMIEKLEK